MAKISISASTVLYFAALAFFDGAHLLPLICAIALHEMGHILCAKALKIKINRMLLSPLGARLEIDGDISYRCELLISLSGPIFGILGFAVSLLFWDRCSYLHSFALISLALGIFNLLPLATLDGGRAVFCLFALVFNLEFAERLMRLLTFFTLFAIWLFSAYIMIKFAGGLSAFVFCVIFFSKCFVFDVETRDL